MNAANLQQVGRLAFRVEGDWWVVYHAQTATMDGAIELSRISMALVQTDERKMQFIAFMRDVFADLIEMTLGVRPQFPLPPQESAEHEKAGRA